MTLPDMPTCRAKFPSRFRSPGRHRVLCLSGGRMTESQLPELQLVGKIFAHAAGFLGTAEKLTRRLDRLRATLEIARTFASAREPQELLELIAHEATRLLGSDRAAFSCGIAIRNSSWPVRPWESKGASSGCRITEESWAR